MSKDDTTPLTPEERERHRWVMAILGIGAAIAWAFALVAARHAPWVPDLYRLLYGAAPRHQPEGTAMFLFAFPTMISVAFAVNVIAPDLMVRRSRSRFPQSEGGRFAFALLWTTFLLIATFVRARAVLDYHR